MPLGQSPRDRCELLGIIRSDFERIHYDIRNLQPQAMVPVPGYPNTVVPYADLLLMEKGGLKKLPLIAGGKLIGFPCKNCLMA